MDVSLLQPGGAGMTVTVPEGSFLLWIDYSGLNLAHPAEFLLEKARVSVNDGAAFGNAYGQFIRVNFALTPPKIAGGVGADPSGAGRKGIKSCRRWTKIAAKALLPR